VPPDAPPQPSDSDQLSVDDDIKATADRGVSVAPVNEERVRERLAEYRARNESVRRGLVYNAAI